MDSVLALGTLLKNCTPKSMTAERLIAKMQLQEERDWRQKREEWKRQLAQPKLVSKAQDNINKAVSLRKRTYEINCELATQEMLATEEKRYQAANLALHRRNMTNSEKLEQDELTYSMGVYYSAICPEISPSWREDATAAFKNRKL
jgi:hypothetical protein